MRFIRTRLVQVLVDALVVCLALTLAYAIRFAGTPPGLYRKQFLLVLPYLVLLRLAILGAAGVYRLVWRYVSVRDVARIVTATATASIMIAAARFVAGPLLGATGLVVNPAHATVPWSVLLAEFVFTTAGLVSVRGAWRLTQEEMGRRARRGGRSRGPHRALLIGAGSAGVMVARELRSKTERGIRIVGFVDDDPRKQGTMIHGLRVFGATAELPELSRKLKADLAIIAIGNATAPAVRRIVELAKATAMKVQIIPDLSDIVSGHVSISQLRDVDIEDLLRRDPVELDETSIETFLARKIVLVTGAGGSIGSEICRQVCRFGPRAVVLLDQAENPLFHVHRELASSFPDIPLDPVVANVTEITRMRAVLESVRPEVIFHAAAHKHVPLMEANPGEAIRNNVGGSRVVADLAHEAGVQAFVMVSTDKAVNPTSVMGATKRLAEMYVQALASVSRTRFITVRFGNVLGSEGSVVPLFKEAIAAGGPVRVTHPDMKRYFMTIPEASKLVLQASAMGRGGEIFVLEMGEPIPIVSLARDLIRLSGYEPDRDIEIVFTGMRPGEKLSEEIHFREENATKTRHPRIWIGKSAASDRVATAASIERLLARVDEADAAALRTELERVVPEYAAWKPDAREEGVPRARGGNRTAPRPRGKAATLPRPA